MIRVEERTLRVITEPSIESLTFCQADQITVEGRIMRKGMAGSEIE